MDTAQTSSTISGFVEKNIKLLRISEVVFFVLMILGLAGIEMNISNSDIILIFGAIICSISLFLQAFQVYEFENIESFNVLGTSGFINFIHKIYYMGLSVSIASNLGFVIDFPKGNPMALIGGLTLISVVLLSLFSKIDNKSKVYSFQFYLRIIICLVLISYLAMAHEIIK